MQRLATQLLRKAGLGSLASIHPVVRPGVTNDNVFVLTEDGGRYLLRRYRWPHDSPDIDRGHKEVFLHGILHAAGVPVPRILASDEGATAILMEAAEGELLGDVAARVGPEVLSGAWRQYGSALFATHNIELSEVPGVIVGTQVSPFPQDSWSQWAAANLVEHAERLALRERIVEEELPRIRELAEMFGNLARPHSSRLLHNDPHPWNVLVRKVGADWELSVVLDWEYAWSGDPEWDLARLDVFRIIDIGSAPDSFYEGYGRMPDEPAFGIYRLSLQFWMLNEYHAGSRRFMTTYDAASADLLRLPEILQTVKEELARGGTNPDQVFAIVSSPRKASERWRRSFRRIREKPGTLPRHLRT